LKRAEWNRLADEFETSVCDVTRSDKKRQVERLVDALRLPGRKPVLVDLGCGLGTFIKQFGARFHRIVGIDFAPRMVERAMARCPKFPRITWQAMDVARAHEAFGASADLMVCMNVITSPSAARRKGLWASIAAVVKPRGLALIVVPSLESARLVHEVEHGRPASAHAQRTGLLARSGAVQKHYARAELDRILPEHGLAVERIAPLYYPWSEEGLATPRRRVGTPFDWVCVARRIADAAARSGTQSGKQSAPAAALTTGTAVRRTAPKRGTAPRRPAKRAASPRSTRAPRGRKRAR
jgi:SAM-dependent methyltransferase